MNGRIYDPLLGRFLSADTLVDGTGDLQGYNRYSYVKNRPLSATDPSGFFGYYPGLDRDIKSVSSGSMSKIVGGVGLTVAGAIPYVGDALDVKDVVSPDSSRADRAIAGASLTVNAATGGLAPNAGPMLRGVRNIGSGFADLFREARTMLRGSDGAATVTAKVTEATADTLHSVPTPPVKSAAPEPVPVEVSSTPPLKDGGSGSGGSGSSVGGDVGGAGSGGGPAGGAKPDFIVTPDGVAIPMDPATLKSGLSNLTETSTNPSTSRKFVSEDAQGPIRIRIEKAHPSDPNFTGTPDPLHTVDHLHIDRRANGQTGKWDSEQKIEYEWPF